MPALPHTSVLAQGPMLRLGLLVLAAFALSITAGLLQTGPALSGSAGRDAEGIDPSAQAAEDASARDAAPASAHRPHHRRSRQTLAMPYFSFAARS